MKISTGIISAVLYVALACVFFAAGATIEQGDEFGWFYVVAGILIAFSHWKRVRHISMGK